MALDISFDEGATIGEIFDGFELLEADLLDLDCVLILHGWNLNFSLLYIISKSQRQFKYERLPYI